MTSVIAFHTLHDANVCITVDGNVKAVLELERLFDVRYFCSAPAKTKFTEQWKEALDCITKFVGIHSFDIAVTSWVFPSQRSILQTLVKADRWVTVDHHICHTTLGLFDSPFRHALVFSYDGGGNDGTFLVFKASRDVGVRILGKVNLNLGSPFRDIAMTMPEVTGQPWAPDKVSAYVRFAPLALAGKVMGYAALGKVRPEWIPALKEFYLNFSMPLASMFTLGEQIGLRLEQNGIESSNDARDLAATSQHVFNLLLTEQVAKYIDVYLTDSSHTALDGLVLTGGCALNVHGNQLIADKYGLPVHVPSAPNDCGISIGAAWSVTRPKTSQQIQYMGLPLFDVNYLNATANKRGAEKVSTADVAELLVKGAIIGIARGRQEFGPRALGHRSLICYPNKAELKDVINKLKSREWFRPLCPAVTEECAAKLFEATHQSNVQYKHESQTKHRSSSNSSHVEEWSPSAIRDLCISSTKEGDDKSWIPASPYMSFAPRLTAHAQKMFPAITHYDGTARLQTVSSAQEPWFHSLLVEVGKLTGYEILMNTSLNVKGKPIVNRLKTVLNILDTSPSDTMDYVLIEDWLFCANRTSKR